MTLKKVNYDDDEYYFNNDLNETLKVPSREKSNLYNKYHIFSINADDMIDLEEDLEEEYKYNKHVVIKKKMRKHWDY
ncbi:hypothetical protein KAZ01_00075 [Candidatus Gracilibacteria bacterium]|jgi:hypothetical protein|nr:hypothetical protein [Candidatus Gracilibacteria bacterium]